ncbi:hypothetical protein NIES4102_31640 [Chondrocystis sp. NIES-4102]|nr:hypothetical protein NIES4102_31640 [Chondrocystis sp. NIES-4102]
MSDNSEINTYPTAGQLERTLAQNIKALYREWFGSQPSQVDCHLLGNKIVILVKDVITPIEQLLLTTESFDLLVQIREVIDQVIRPKLQQLVEEISQVEVIKCLYNTALEYSYVGAILLLANPPTIRPTSKLGQNKD